MTPPNIHAQSSPSPRALFTLSRRTIVIALLGTVFLAAIVATYTYRNNIDSYLQARESGVKTLALSFSAEELAALHRGRSGDSAGACREIQSRLDRARASTPGITVVELLHFDIKTGTIACFARSSMPGVPVTPPALPPKVHRQLLRDGASVQLTRHPGHAYFIDGYIFITRHPADGEDMLDLVHSQTNATKQVVESLVGAGHYALGILLLFFIPLSIYFVTRGKIRQECALHERIMAVEQCKTAISISTLHQHNSYANQGLVRQYGYSREELSRIKWWELAVQKPRGIESSWRALFAPGAKPRAYELMLRRKNGEIFPARLAITPLRIKDAKGRETCCCISISTDLTERNKPSLLLEQAKRRAQDASRAKSVFIATMSHELRTPLNGIIGFASLLLDTPLNPAQAASVRSIHKHGKTLMQLAINILEITSIDSGGMRVAPVECDPLMLILEVIGIADAESKHQRVRFLPNIHPDIPDTLFLDTPRLRQILIGLAISADRHIQAGEVEISLRRAPVAGSSAPAATTGNNPFMMEIAVRGRTSIPVEPGAAAARAPKSESAPLGLLMARRFIHLLRCTVIQENRDAGNFIFIFSIPCRSIAPERHRPL